MSQGFAQKQHTSLRDKIQQSKSTSYPEFVKNVNEKYQAFRDSVNAHYAAMMERVWKSYPIKEAKKPPVEKELEPVYYDKEKDGQYLEEQKRLESEKRLAEEKKKLHYEKYIKKKLDYNYSNRKDKEDISQNDIILSHLSTKRKDYSNERFEKIFSRFDSKFNEFIKKIGYKPAEK